MTGQQPGPDGAARGACTPDQVPPGVPLRDDVQIDLRARDRSAGGQDDFWVDWQLVVEGPRRRR